MVVGLQPGYRFTDLLIDLGPVQFGAVDAAGVHWHCATVEGWDGTEVRAEMSQREGDHGAWPAPAYLSERVITLAGKLVAPSPAALDVALEQLLAAASLTDTTLVVHETIPKQATVRRSAKPLAQRLTDRVLDYSVQVTAADPRRYAVDQQQGSTGLPSSSGGLTPPYTLPYTLSATTVAGEIVARNLGSFETRPVLTVSGPVSQPQMLAQMPDGTVRPLLYGLDLAAGEQLVIDTAARSVTLTGGVSRRRFLAVPLGWPTIPAGSAVTFRFQAAAYDPSALLTARWRSAWI